MDSNQSSADAETAAGEGRSSSSGKTLIIAVLGSVLAAVVLLAVFLGGEETSNASEISDLTFLTADGETASLGDFQGEPLVVNFFASWCAPCRAELPDFEQVHLANEGQVRFIGVNHDLEEATWRGFVEETKITYETVFQPTEDIWRTLDAKGMPSTAFVSADGEVLQLWTGVLNDDKLQELIDEHLLETA